MGISELWKDQSEVEFLLPSVEPSYFFCLFFSTYTALKDSLKKRVRKDTGSVPTLVSLLFSLIILGALEDCIFLGSAKGLWRLRVGLDSE